MSRPDVVDLRSLVDSIGRRLAWASPFGARAMASALEAAEEILRDNAEVHLREPRAPGWYKTPDGATGYLDGFNRFAQNHSWKELGAPPRAVLEGPVDLRYRTFSALDAWEALEPVDVLGARRLGGSGACRGDIVSRSDRLLGAALSAIESYKTAMALASVEIKQHKSRISELEQQLAAEQGRLEGALSDAWAWDAVAEVWSIADVAHVSRAPALDGWLVRLRGDMGSVHAEGALQGMRKAVEQIEGQEAMVEAREQPTRKMTIGADGFVTWAGEGVADG